MNSKLRIIYLFSTVSAGMLHPQRIHSLNKKIASADLGKLTLIYSNLIIDMKCFKL